MMKRITLLGVLLLLWLSAYSQVFSSNEERQRVEADYQAREQLMKRQLFNRELPGVQPDEWEALQFLYAYMPLADLTDYSNEFYLRQVRTTLEAQQQLPWGQRVPTLLFRHFVLPLRVNNENLDEARTVLFHALKERIGHLPMKEAILEVNHWCHEHVTYQPSDARTLSPLACMRNALGRCGEESTFTVAALRAVGIPARQVYTPRWSHTDDNHAWVEAWADGQWYFLGACEPEAVLDLGWFNEPASRAMLMHTRAFGKYEGPEEVVLRANNFTEINLINNYADTARVDFCIMDTHGKPVEGARVEFKIYNYAEFYTAVTKYTDESGCTFLTAGLGDLLVWASKDGLYGYQKASFGKDKNIEIVLDSVHIAHQVTAVDIVPPTGKDNRPTVSSEQDKENKRRFAQEDSIRKAYESTFYQLPENATEIDELCRKARSNWRTIRAFYDESQLKERAMQILRALSTKDLEDITRPLLDDVYTATSDEVTLRVEDEMLIRPSRRFIEQQFTEKEKRQFRRNPQQLVEWIDQHVRQNPDPKALRIAQTPIGALQWRMTDNRSRDILIVSMARAFGIKAEKDPLTGKLRFTETDSKGKPLPVNHKGQGMLLLDFTPSHYIDDAKYYTHFTLSKIVKGRAQLLTYDEGELDMGGGTSWSNTFKNGVWLDAGRYLLVTGTRLANGSVLATTEEVLIEAGDTTRLPLVLRQSNTDVSVIGSFDSEAKIKKDGNDVSILSQTGRGYFIVGCVEPGQEPTNHALRDICKEYERLNAWGRPLIFLFSSEQALQQFQKETYGTLPFNTILAVDERGMIARQIVAQMKLTNADARPLFIIADTFNRVVFCSQGYTIGLGQQLMKTILGL